MHELSLNNDRARESREVYHEFVYLNLFAISLFPQSKSKQREVQFQKQFDLGLTWTSI